jgi:spore maturation protein CgeB
MQHPFRGSLGIDFYKNQSTVKWLILVVAAIIGFGSIFYTKRLVDDLKDRERINLNICTDAGASDRIYKILAAGGFLLTNEWEGRELTGLVDGRDLVIYNDIGDLNNKINLYLDDVDRREKIAESGFRTVQKLNRLEWAKYITYEK